MYSSFVYGKPNNNEVYNLVTYSMADGIICGKIQVTCTLMLIDDEK